MTAVVVDASFAITWFADEAGSASAARLLTSSDHLIAPDIMLVEVANAMWRKSVAGDVRMEAVDETLNELLRLEFEWISTRDLVRDAAALAIRHRHPVYDALYVILARRRGALLATRDRRLAKLAAADDEPIDLWTPRHH